MAITATEARGDLTVLIERVNADCVDVEIISSRGSAVLMSKDRYDSLKKASYLLSSPENARRLMAALESTKIRKAPPGQGTASLG
ncbi:type II toxin-antitoxin system prevent-host-death family antitoxin [Arthrobacter flavus]|uniref:Antitoxin n=1 Tax=Arthrobacter flavus TaxID=95172 RepID=A0ABW4Q965_9MICC